MVYVAQLNEQRICTGVGQLAAVPPGPLFVVIPSYDETLLGRHHDGQAWGPEPVPPTPVPEVSMAQAVIALSRAGVSEEAVASAIDALPDGPGKTEARIWWARSNVMRRNHPAVALLAPQLGLTEEQVDALFAAAQAVQA